MLIGIISDTHDNARYLLKAVKVFNEKNVELVIHCGDWVSPCVAHFCKDLNCKIISVFGNNEGDKFLFLKWKKEKNWNIEFHNKTVELELDGKKLIAYHGDSKPILKSLIESQIYDVVLSGHTHNPVIETHGNTLHINPGSLSGMYKEKIVENYTIAIYDTKSNSADIIPLK